MRTGRCCWRRRHKVTRHMHWRRNNMNSAPLPWAGGTLLVGRGKYTPPPLNRCCRHRRYYCYSSSEFPHDVILILQWNSPLTTALKRKKKPRTGGGGGVRLEQETNRRDTRSNPNTLYIHRNPVRECVYTMNMWFFYFSFRKHIVHFRWLYTRFTVTRRSARGVNDHILFIIFMNTESHTGYSLWDTADYSITIILLYYYYYYSRCTHIHTRHTNKHDTTRTKERRRSAIVRHALASWLAVLWNDNYDDGPHDPMTGLGMGIMTLYPLLTICI